MKLSALPALAGASLLLFSLSTHAAVVEVGDLNIIDDAGNASDGLRFLDLSFSVGLTQAAALTNAQATYANARLATAAEWDDLFSAAGIGYDATLTAADVFSTGDTADISSGANYDSGVLLNQLGLTTASDSFIWSDPDGSSVSSTTRDFMRLRTSDATIFNEVASPPISDVAWMIVSDAAVVPVPAAGWLFISAVAGLIGKKRLSRQ